jgi:hypothetical protein
MKFSVKSLVVVLTASVAFPALSSAQHYVQKNLVSDIAQPANSDGSAVVVDPNLQNPWGLTRSSTSPWWISDNGPGVSSVYTGTGTRAPRHHSYSNRHRLQRKPHRLSPQ